MKRVVIVSHKQLESLLVEHKDTEKALEKIESRVDEDTSSES